METFIDLYLKNLNEIKDTISDDDKMTYNLQLIIEHYKNNGEKRYKVSDNLHMLLLDTNISDVLGKDIKLPFYSFVIDTPTIFNSNDEDITVNQLIITEFMDMRANARKGKRGIEIRTIGKNNKIKLDCECDMCKLNRYQDYIIIFDFENDNQTIKEALVNGKHKDCHCEACRARAKISQENKEFEDKIIQYVLNFIMYVTSKNADIESNLLPIEQCPRAERKRFKRTGQRDKKEVFLVGSKIYLPYEYKQYCESKQQGKKLDHTIKVQGHWRWQPYGKDRAKTKHIFISPYLKGVEYNTPIQKTDYIVRQAKEVKKVV